MSESTTSTCSSNALTWLLSSQDSREAVTSALLIAKWFMSSFTLCVVIAMYFDLSGKWSEYAMHKCKRDVTFRDYKRGYLGLLPKFIFIFIPAMAAICHLKADAIHRSPDKWYTSAAKLAAGNVFGIVWAGVVHYILHHPKLYKFHKAHHASAPQNMTATAYGEVSVVEYVALDVPLFMLSMFLFPTHFRLHLIHFAWHGWDEASAHCGFNPPGYLSWFFDGEFHYHHHNNPNVNYSEFGLMDKLLGTHHTQRESSAVGSLPFWQGLQSTQLAQRVRSLRLQLSLPASKMTRTKLVFVAFIYFAAISCSGEIPMAALS